MPSYWKINGFREILYLIPHYRSGFYIPYTDTFKVKVQKILHKCKCDRTTEEAINYLVAAEVLYLSEENNLVRLIDIKD